MGQVLGVLLVEQGLKLLGGVSTRDLIVICENDRCISDAIQILTNTRLGRRSFKLIDYGKMAATFCDLKSGKSYRVWVSGNITKKGEYHSFTKEEQVKELDRILYSKLEDVVSYKEVIVKFNENELPGKPKRIVWCAKCNEKVMDGKDVMKDGMTLCKSCANGGYYEEIK
jgi:formylmethanofuran dehydrogenase subunit E